MEKVIQDENSWTHIHWELESVNADMIDWHWANLEKCFILWHPEEHRGFCWEKAPDKDHFIGAIHKTIQGGEPKDLRDPTVLKHGLRYYDIASLPKEMQDVVIYDHVCVVGRVTEDNWDAIPSSYRIHQWQATDKGVVGMSSALTPNVVDVEEEKRKLMNWSKHASGETSNWGVYLPVLYNLYRVVTNPDVNIHHSLKVERKDGLVRYVSLK